MLTNELTPVLCSNGNASDQTYDEMLNELAMPFTSDQANKEASYEMPFTSDQANNEASYDLGWVCSPPQHTLAYTHLC